MPIQQSNTKKLMDISKNKINEKMERLKLLQEEIKQEERKHKLFKFMENDGYTEEEVIKYLGLEVSEEVVETQVDDKEQEFNYVQEAIDTSDDEYTEVSENEGPIDTNICDEIVDLEFSEDGQEANKQLVKRLLEEQDLYFKEKNENYSIKKNGKEIIIINRIDEKYNRYDYGLITTIRNTNDLNIVSNWQKFGAKQAKRRMYDFKGKNIEEVVQMIHNILN